MMVTFPSEAFWLSSMVTVAMSFGADVSTADIASGVGVGVGSWSVKSHELRMMQLSSTSTMRIKYRISDVRMIHLFLLLGSDQLKGWRRREQARYLPGVSHQPTIPL